MSRIVITGANGLVGRAVCRLALAQGHTVTALVRRPDERCPPGAQVWVHSSADFAGLDAAWPAQLRADSLIHLAARVHVMRDDAPDPQAAFDATNVTGTLRVAEAAHKHGVSRVVFASSIKAVAEGDRGQPLTEAADPRPEDPYGLSKLRAEQALARYGEASGLDAVVVRTPLVYGPEVRANFLRMMDTVWRGLPLPLGAVAARRSVAYVDNLADALLRCATDPRAARGLFHVADSDAPSVAALLTQVGLALGRPARLFPMPVSVLRAAASLAGRRAQIDRLTGSLQLDTTHIEQALEWRPPFSTEEGLAATAAWYRQQRLGT